MSPALSESPRAEGNQHSNGEHFRIALRLRGGLVQEGADTGILLMDKVPRVGVVSVEFRFKLGRRINHSHQVFCHVM